jgi:hypothetical protein
VPVHLAEAETGGVAVHDLGAAAAAAWSEPDEDEVPVAERGPAAEGLLPVDDADVATDLRRSERPEEIILSWSDWGWITFYGVTCTAVIQCIAIAVAIFNDRRLIPLFPRWAGFFNLWVAPPFCPGTILMFVKNGPFAWNGLFVFWIPFAAFVVWMVVMTKLLLQAVERHDPAEEPGSVAELRGEVAELSGQLTYVTGELGRLRKELMR